MNDDTVSKVVVRADVFAAGQLPPICVISGRAATESKVKTAQSPIGVAWIGLCMGLLPFLIIRAITTKSITGGIPLDPGAKQGTAWAEQRKTKLIIGAAAFAVGLGGAFLAGDTDFGDSNGVSGWIGAISILLIAIGMFTAAFGIRSRVDWIAPSYNHKQGEITLHHVHRAFADALAQPMAAVAWQTAGPAPQTFGAVQPQYSAPGAGWHRDPSGRAESRYWDGAAWTAHVTGPGGQGYDPL